MRLVLCILAACAAHADSVAGYWQGVLKNNGQETPLALEFTETGETVSGSVSLPEYGWMGHVFRSVEVKRNTFQARFGFETQFVFDGELKGRGDNQSLAGTAELGKHSMQFAARKSPKPALAYTVEQVTFTNGDVTLAGAVYAPAANAKHGAVVLLHGSGDNDRWMYNEPADWFARHGMVCLVFDKRGNGKSTGKWLDVGFNELADDGIAGLRYLQTRPDVDPKRIGFWGISQAGWLMEIAAQRCPDTAYFICISGGTALVEREGFYDYEYTLRANGFSEQDIAEAVDMLRRYNVTVRTEQGYQEFLEWMQPMRQKPWFSKLEWVPRPPDAIFQRWYRRVMDFDPEPVVRELDIPMLFIYGEADDSNPTAEGVAMLNKVKAETGNDMTIIAFPGADHGVKLPATKDAAFPFRRRVDGFWPEQAKWLQTKGFMDQ